MDDTIICNDTEKSVINVEGLKKLIDMVDGETTHTGKMRVINTEIKSLILAALNKDGSKTEEDKTKCLNYAMSNLPINIYNNLEKRPELVPEGLKPTILPTPDTTSPLDTARSSVNSNASTARSTSSTESNALSSALFYIKNSKLGHNDPYMKPIKLPIRNGGKHRRKTVKKMSKRKLTKWCKSKKNRRSKKGRKMCKKLSRKSRN
jgi:hypothetical protein